MPAGRRGTRSFVPSDTRHDSNAALARCAAHREPSDAHVPALPLPLPRFRPARREPAWPALLAARRTEPPASGSAARRLHRCLCFFRSYPKFIVVSAHFEGAKPLRRSFAGVRETSTAGYFRCHTKLSLYNNHMRARCWHLLFQNCPLAQTHASPPCPSETTPEPSQTLEHPITDFAVKATQTGGAARGSVTAKRPTATQAGCAVAGTRHHRHCCSFLHRRAV